MRADARRNYERLVAQARATFLEQGCQASLEDIARRAGVGIGTLYRHFPSRGALLGAVFQGEVDALLALGEELLDAEDPLAALAEWLRAVLRHSGSYRGLAQAMIESDGEPRSTRTMESCKAPMRAAGRALLDQARQAGSVRRDTGISDLLKLTHAIGLAAEKTPEEPELADRLLALVLGGLRVPD